MGINEVLYMENIDYFHDEHPKDCDKKNVSKYFVLG